MASFGWDEKKETAESSFTVLPEGEYDFTVKDFERGYYNGGRKIGPCDMAVYTLHVVPETGQTADIRTNLMLDDSLLWKITNFFKGCGLIDPGTAEGTEVEFPWDRAVGCKGRCIVTKRTYTDRNGNEREANDIDRLVVPEPAGGYGDL